MANFQPTTEQLDTLLAIPINQLRRPAMPVSIYLQEANDLYVWSQDDRAKLLEVGLTLMIFDELMVGFHLLKYYQGRWKKEQKQVEPQLEVLQEKQQQARQLQQDVASSFRFAFRQEPELLKTLRLLLKTLRLLLKRAPYAALYQSLNDLAVLGESHPDLLLSTGFNLDALGQLRQLAAELPEWHASAVKKTSNSKELRDRAYHYLKARVDELRACGKYVFRQVPSRQVGYVSQFMKRKSQAQKQAGTQKKE
ncbi:hypothetical protein [Sunxiuqinia sp. sy24]|uniref:hypothetical protein n=1 Tax=Sunxiuqinia sp. sy24 TaxID=3461495 RepID=UPI004045855A